MGDGAWVGFGFMGDLPVFIVRNESCEPTPVDMGATWGVGLWRGVKAEGLDASANDLLEILAGGGLEGMPVLLRAALYDPWVAMRGVGVGCCLGGGRSWADNAARDEDVGYEPLGINIRQLDAEPKIGPNGLLGHLPVGDVVAHRQ